MATKLPYPTISTGTWIGFALFLVLILVLYNTKLKPVAIILALIIAIGIILRFEPQFVGQLKNA